MNELRRIGRGIQTTFAGFRSVGIAFTIFVTLNVTVFLLVRLFPGLLDHLQLSAGNPWGIITSAFVQVKLPHLANNLGCFAVFTALFVLVCYSLNVEVRRRWSHVFLWFVFLSGIMANEIEYLLIPVSSSLPSYGASGIVYGSEGILLAACAVRLPSWFEVTKKALRKLRSNFKKTVRAANLGPLGILAWAMPVIVLAVFVPLLVVNAPSFFSVGLGVDVLAHVLGFFIGLLGFPSALVLLERGVRRR